MKSAVETLAPTRVKVTVEVPYAELKPSVDSAIKAIGSQISVPGFRHGKVPARIIEQRVGRGAVLQEAINEALPGFFGQAVDDNNLRPIGQPEVEITQVPMEDDQELAFTAEVDVRPEITLPDLDAIAVSVDDIEVTEEDVQEQLDTLRARFGTLVTVEREAAMGDFVTIDLSATIGEEEIDSVTGISYEIGSGNMLPGMDDALIGLAAGSSTTFTAPLAGGDHQGEDAECTVTVQAVKERELPELDDDFAALASEFDTLAELRANVTHGVEQGKRFAQGVQARDRILDHLLESLDVPLPEGIIDAEVNSHLEGEDRLEDDEHRAEVDANTRRSLKTQFILDALVEQEEVDVSQEEFVEYLMMQAQQFRMDPGELAKALDSNGQVPAMVVEVARRKALAAVLDRATITDASGNAVDLNLLVEEEGDGDEEAASAEDSTAQEPIEQAAVAEDSGEEAPVAEDSAAEVRAEPTA
ncbi:MAG: trigger factor [Tetrasphaera sp.]